MSVPDFTGDVKRATRLTVSGRLPISGEMVVQHRRVQRPAPSSMRWIIWTAWSFWTG